MFDYTNTGATRTGGLFFSHINSPISLVPSETFPRAGKQQVHASNRLQSAFHRRTASEEIPANSGQNHSLCVGAPVAQGFRGYRCRSGRDCIAAARSIRSSHRSSLPHLWRNLRESPPKKRASDCRSSHRSSLPHLWRNLRESPPKKRASDRRSSHRSSLPHLWHNLRESPPKKRASDRRSSHRSSLPHLWRNLRESPPEKRASDRAQQPPRFLAASVARPQPEQGSSDRRSRRSSGAAAAEIPRRICGATTAGARVLRPPQQAIMGRSSRRDSSPHLWRDRRQSKRPLTAAAGDHRAQQPPRFLAASVA
ncbi:uncharacterized protein LOC129739262 [Uranotaenia lowii]|uniref:uncharacterized protein LOC129739262 n=1 Tax=Uranotaenia lowii TaxID=190385 RepID=UPI00247AF567|nr:uncharacterized protein LOC129739262 [Uranotaenia lowii]